MTSNHWLIAAWSRKERHLAVEAATVHYLLLKQKQTHSLEGMCGKRARSHAREVLCAVQLTGSLVRRTLRGTDAI